VTRGHRRTRARRRRPASSGVASAHTSDTSEVPSLTRIRRYQSRDAASVADVFFRSVRVLGARHYTPLQVEAWAPFPPEADACHARCTDGRITLVVTGDCDAPLAYGDLEASGHIDQLYCAPEAAGTGVTAALYVELERMAREQGMARIYTEASEGARRFFERQGFSTRERRNFRLRGVAIHNHSMDRVLAAPPRSESLIPAR